MAKFIVGVREVHVSSCKVEARDEADAKAKVADGEGEEIVCEYSHTLDRKFWSVERMVEMVPCKFCGRQVSAATAHLHAGGWVGEECCWDERLKASE